MSEKTRNTLFVYGKNKREWQLPIFEEIDKSQLTKEYDGTKDFPLDIDEFRRQNGTFDCATS